MAEDLSGALTLAQQICWNETVGYTMGGDMNPDTDCSGLVGYCLSQNGFSVNRRWDTGTMITALQNYPGFTEYIYSSGFQWQHGDIAVYDEGGGRYGHTFFYAENVLGYTDNTGRTNTTGLLSTARIEASSSRTSGYSYADGDPGTIPGDVNNPNTTGDYPRNGVGAYWEVWVHPFSFSEGGHVWHIFRWQAGPGPTPPTTNRHHLPIWFYNKIIRKEI